MNPNKLSSLLPALLVGSAFLACGGISDPSKTGAGTNIATVTGALSSDTAVPAGAHVAVVWRKGSAGGYAIGADAAIIDGKFTLNVAAPPDSYLMEEGSGSGSGSGSAPSVDVPPSPEEDPGAPPSPTPGGKSIKTMDSISGGITGSLKAAIAGFIVYVDANGNNALDLEGSHAGSPDTILGGNDDLTLAYLTGGGQLDYEKLRDKSGILPAAGFNLMWDDERWVGLNLVELKITSETKLPRSVCSSGHFGGETPPSAGSGGAVPTEDPDPLTPPDPDAGAPPTTYPSPGDPDLTCAPDGSYFSYGHCEVPPPPPAGLCSDPMSTILPCAKQVTYRPEPVPSNWPCPGAPPPVDAGSGP